MASSLRSEHLPDPSWTRSKQLGEKAGEILRHATQKQAMVTDLSDALRRLDRKRGKTINAEDILARRERLLNEKAIEENKLAGRKQRVINLVQAGVELSLLTLEEEPEEYQGRLTAVNLWKATLELRGKNGATTSIEYAKSLPVPEGLDQTYYGHGLVVALEVLSIPADNAWVLRY